MQLCSNDMILSINYQPQWQHNRVNFIVDLYGKDFFNNKRILELGAFNGVIGNRFSQLGSKVTCVEGREENAKFIKDTFPHLNVIVDNLDTDVWKFGHWDIVIHFGLFYHLEFYHEMQLNNTVKNCDVLFFESVIYDSFEDEIRFGWEGGQDQSLSEKAGMPTTKWVENIFDKNSVKYKLYKDSRLNGEQHRYDWIEQNSKTYDGYKRRLWVVSNMYNL